MSLELHRASVIHNCWEVVPSCTKCKNICANVCIHFHHSVKSIRLRLRQEFVPADGNTAWVMKQRWINTGYKTTYYSWSHNCCYWLGCRLWNEYWGVFYCILALMCFANILGCICIVGLIRSCDKNTLVKKKCA